MWLISISTTRVVEVLFLCCSRMLLLICVSDSPIVVAVSHRVLILFVLCLLLNIGVSNKNVFSQMAENGI